MFKEIFLFELKQCFRKPAVYIFFGVYFLLNLMLGLATTGAFNTTRSDSNMIVNSASVIAGILLGTSSNLFGFLGNILLIFTMAVAIQKDFQYNTHSLYFTKPITKFQYFFGRLLSTYLVAIFVFSALILGYYFGSLYGMGTPKVGAYKFINYIQPFLVFTIPNVFLLGIIFFSVTTYVRNTMASYIIAIVILVVQIAASTVTSDIENKALASLLEPTGSRALSTVTEYWSPAERNSNLLPLNGLILQNRLIWISVSLLIMFFSYWKFSFSQFLNPLTLFKRKDNDANEVAPNYGSLNEIPKPTLVFSNNASLKQLLYLSSFEFKKSIRSIFYIIMVILSIGTMLLAFKFMTSAFDTPTYLVTYKAIESIFGSVSTYGFIFIVFYAGTMVWRERESKTDELIGSSPIANKVLFGSKILGLLMATILLDVIGAFSSILIQFYDGFLHVNYSQYLVEILISALSSIVVICYCICIQVFAPNKFLGFFICIAPLVVFGLVFPLLEWDVFLLEFNSTGSGDPYSDMNGYGRTFVQYPIYRMYWYSFIFFFVCLAVLVYARGKEKSIKARFNLSKYFFNLKYKMLIAFSVLSTVVFGAYIFYEKRIVDDYTPSKEAEKLTADYEKKYKKYEKLKQPRIVATNVNVDLYTKTGEFHAAGIYTIKNKHTVAIDSIYVNYNDSKKSSYKFSKLGPTVAFKEVLTDKENGIKIFKLTTPLQPNDSINFEFDMTYKPKDYYHKAYSSIHENGTFINNDYFPNFGYNSNAELSQNSARKEYKLKPKPRMASITDTNAVKDNYISNDADWIRFETTVSTDEGQTAIAPGYLQKEWRKDGRHYFNYKMDSPILNFYSFLSANYQTKKEKWQDVNLEIYYQKGHEYNLDRMMKSMKKSLDYYSNNFGPYQHKQLRIIEFPRYSTFAQSFPNTIPFSESIGFITKVDDNDPESIDVPFYVTAHEVAHQWWAHQVIGGNVQGSVLMSETMSQYSAMMIMEKEYGKDAMKKFLKHEMDDYLKGRAFESQSEMPMLLVENQQYIHYNKGSVIMYALKDYIGEEKLNGAIKEYLNATKFNGPPYSTAFEFVSYIKKATPDSLQYLVTDAFENITLYENYVKKIDYKKISDKEYKVSVTVGSVKFYGDSTGKLKKGNMNDYFDIGVFGLTKVKNKQVDKPLAFTRVKLTSQEQTFDFTVNEKPESAGIDPYLKLIDRTPKNNTCKFGKTPEKPNLSLKNDDITVFMGNNKED